MAANANVKEKTYLRWYNKLGYGSGDLAANMVYALLTSFVMIYLTFHVSLLTVIVASIILLLLTQLNVEKANADWDAAHGKEQ
ncbi:MAG: hypothetical protein IJ061_09470 [Lachnospiraceae bacterium]|nr:hypothetical protein [Lachnospiraceae bacterium]